MSKLLRERWNRLAFSKGNQSLNEAEEIGEAMHASGIPQSLWEMADSEEAMDEYGSYEAVVAKLQSYTPEHLQMKIDQLREEIDEDMQYMDDPQNQYDTMIYPKESLIHIIEDVIAGRP